LFRANALADMLRSAIMRLLPTLVLLDVSQGSIVVVDGGRLVAIAVHLRVVVPAGDIGIEGGVNRVDRAVVSGPLVTITGATGARLLRRRLSDLRRPGFGAGVGTSTTTATTGAPPSAAVAATDPILDMTHHNSDIHSAISRGSGFARFTRTCVTDAAYRFCICSCSTEIRL
jgi:hypothetical protein